MTDSIASAIWAAAAVAIGAFFIASAVLKRWKRSIAYADTLFELAQMYNKGSILPKNLSEAAKTYRQAAGLGHARAQYWLGGFFQTGVGVQEDHVAAEKWYRKAAKQGLADAQADLGSLYAFSSQYGKGRQIPQDFSEAAKWLDRSFLQYRKEALRGNPEAQEKLATAYSTGLGISKDGAAAFQWYCRAAEQGHAVAQTRVAMQYVKGEHVQKDLVQALAWFDLAIPQLLGHVFQDDAIADREAVANALTAEEIAEAERLTSTWRPKSDSK